ncbi:hypothetical protein BSK59_32935 [Paenibacillus odorifer]|uniref:hypothetical protein n=1 Tax=Paenibacillus odorifer TaxID=189426 RepID=UPI00096C50DA|nr:hypothetical protein [Paenibacillus odorifer]OME45309.1 hypothetical protein BSK59_32935 [Paenibacillus odorifer]
MNENKRLTIVWKLIKKYKIPILVFLAPVIINYSLFTWKAPGVFGDPKTWLGFLGSYLGVIGAIYLALFQIRKQREYDEKRDKEYNRSYVDMHEFQAPMMLEDVKTHENSRIINTPGYKHLLDIIPEKRYKNTKVSYYKLAHFGNSEVIVDCKFQTEVRFKSEDTWVFEKIEVNIGAIEKGVEIYIPLVPMNIQMGEEMMHDDAVFTYTTSKNERMKLSHNLITQKDELIVIHTDAKIEVLYEYDLNGVEWIYPNKIINHPDE